ncbi:hypothetical protein C488_18013 [Natrinema pellirubrum DSM 15624]|uniref:Uncharacterized protein n=1 Tax=Natrinema pellirubrum (strain DSM 15624 / CIP 106293 / JCM 10476 / NCIMB 786 / 157) TaxID=797303 RepID=L0JSW6_NATP1|nr:hypothetical protein [Natrinema pellirubrum]AGB33476.1 hypothetical protein Natpe_3714 [Natrinema pellirubrum DSM 15624]ELY71165.1 hypothetical protein C488_18013 [Natrinema pellirubrum DSM 15624]
MNRRQYLARTGAAGASLGTVTALAGCLDTIEGSSDEADAEVEDRTGQRALDRAAGQLNKAAQRLDEVDGLEDPENVEFDPGEPLHHISLAEEYLETAAAELSDDRSADLETLRSYAAVIEGLVSVTVIVTDDTIEDDIDEVTAAVEANGDIEGANQTVDDRHRTVVSAADRHAQVRETLQSIDGERLTAIAGTDISDLEEGATTLGDVVTSLETLTGAYDSMLDLETGYGALEDGRTQLDNEQFGAARESFETAEGTFGDALQRLEDGTEDAPDGLGEYFETARCQNEHLAAASGHFADAAAAAEDGRYRTARRKRTEGEAALDDVGDCTN